MCQQLTIPEEVAGRGRLSLGFSVASVYGFSMKLFIIAVFVFASAWQPLAALELNLCDTLPPTGSLLGKDLHGAKIAYHNRYTITGADVKSWEVATDNFGEKSVAVKLDKSGMAKLQALQTALFEKDPTARVLVMYEGQQVGKSDMGTSVVDPATGVPMPVGISLIKTEANLESFEKVLIEIKEALTAP